MAVRLSTKSWFPTAVLVILSAIWGSSFILIKKALISFNTIQVGALRMVFAYLAMLPFALQAFQEIPRTQWKYMALIGFVGNFFPSFLFAIAVMNIPSAIAGVLNALTPSFTLLVGLLFYQTKINRLQLTGLFLGLLGSAILSLLKSDGTIGKWNGYMWLVTVATILYGFNTNMIRKHGKDIHPLFISSMSLFFIGPFAIAVFLSTDFYSTFVEKPLVWQSLGYLAILGVLGSAFAVVLFNRLIQLTSAVYASSVTYLIPIVAILWGIFDGEQLVLPHYLGMAIILIGVYMVNKR
ncbi:MAG: DMT family transporter [Flammeovirgaceae bacterium]|nr:DMT family transporter [Flammeovirgaceae bacterium]MDW8288142.1 DMT family transporter [Flammeovirgaceae bacterium]